MVAKTAENAKRSQDRSLENEQTAIRGKEIVEKMIISIAEISDGNEHIMRQIEESNREISEIVKVIGEIGNKTKVINDIVFQTKLLSFNASVEAARAGEHGKGFAVVAEEVGNLAQMSGSAAKEISDMLDSSIGHVEKIVEKTQKRVETLIRDGKGRIDAGTTIARECGQVLDEIVRSVSEVRMMADEISTASSEQSQGISEINRAMNQLDEVTQSNAVGAQQASGHAQELSSYAEKVTSCVHELVREIEGSLVQLSREVGPLPQETRAPVAQDSKVIPIKAELSRPKQHIQKPTASRERLKAVSGESHPVPSHDDPRFEDV
jgi:methyl-accepting chemotaxis protein